MNLIEISKSIIIKEVLKHAHSSKSWRVLVIHEYTASIITKLFKHSELFSYELITLHRIESLSRDNIPDNPAIYFIKANDDIINTIVKDHKNKRYNRYTVISVNELSKKQEAKLSNLKDPKITHKYVKIDFQCFEENIFFCDFNSLNHVAHAINHYFNIHCIKENDVEESKSLELIFDNDSKYRDGDLIILDRVYDLYTPLIRFFTFQALLNDFKLIEDNIYLEKSKDFTDDKLWNKIRFLHISQINKILGIEAVELNEKIKHIQNVGTKDLIKMVLEAPEQIQLKEEVSLFLDLLDQCITKFEKHNLNFLSNVEQNICTKKTPDGSRYTNGVEDFFNISKDEKISLLDKVRAFVLLITSGYDFQQREIDLLVNNGVIEKDDLAIQEKLSMIRNEHIFVKQKDHKYDISRYRPLIYNLISCFIEGKKGFDFICVTDRKQNRMASLRKSEFVFSKEHKSKNKRVLCIYIKGGLTYAEIEIVNTLSVKLGIYIILGSSKILNHENFIEDIKSIKP